MWSWQNLAEASEAFFILSRYPRSKLHAIGQNLARASRDVTGTQLRPEDLPGHKLHVLPEQCLERASQDVTGTQLRPIGSPIHAHVHNLIHDHKVSS